MNIRSETGNITTDTAISKTIQGYYKQLYTHEFENLEEMGQILKNCELWKSNQDETDNLNSPTNIKEIEFIKFQKMKKKIKSQNDFTGNSFKHLKN